MDITFKLTEEKSNGLSSASFYNPLTMEQEYLLVRDGTHPTLYDLFLSGKTYTLEEVSKHCLRLRGPKQGADDWRKNNERN